MIICSWCLKIQPCPADTKYGQKCVNFTKNYKTNITNIVLTGKVRAP